ncbi:MAG: flippase-like domain-containing protein [Chloroflexi bacterium]|nr:flippase-like domain-containing protein [Chloroflexota bacterium]MCL5076422.1 flippase-like domain-containing protein [Chloroflexota bacterium]
MRLRSLYARIRSSAITLVGDRPLMGRELIRRWQIWLGLVLSLFFLWWAFQQATNIAKVGEAIRQANYLYLVPALLAYFGGVYLRAIRWHFLLKPLRRIEARRLFPIIVMGYMVNNTLPARLGEIFRAYILGERQSISKSATFATIIIERVFDSLTMVIFALTASLFMPFEIGLQEVVRPAALFWGGFIVLLLSMALSSQLASKISDLALKVAPGWLRHRLMRFTHSFLLGFQVLHSARMLFSVIVLSIVIWLCEASMYYLVMLAFNLLLPLYAPLLTIAVASLGTMIPSSPGYIGTFDALVVFALKLFGADPNTALSYTAVLHVTFLVPVTLLGFYYLWRHGLSLQVVESGKFAEG